jgi:hypothetical protein
LLEQAQITDFIETEQNSLIEVYKSRELFQQQFMSEQLEEYHEELINFNDIQSKLTSIQAKFD